MDGFLLFGLYFISALGIAALFLYLYAVVTPYDDYKLIFKENNTAAAIGFGGAIIGLCIPLSSALTHSVSYVDFLIWAGVAIAIQLIFAFAMTRIGSKFSLERQINEGVVSVGVLMASMSIGIGLLNAGSLSY